MPSKEGLHNNTFSIDFTNAKPRRTGYLNFQNKNSSGSDGLRNGQINYDLPIIFFNYISVPIILHSVSNAA